MFLFCICGTPVRADQIVHLTVSVTDELGNAVSGARVNVYQQEAKRSRWFDVPVPPDYYEPTNAQGLARLQIIVASGQGLDITIEVSREDMAAQSRNISLGKNFPTRLPLEKFSLKKRSESGGTDVINVVVDVQSEGKPLEGASVLIRDQSLGAKTGRFTGTTGADGKTTIRVWYATPSASETLPIEVSKNGYKDGKGSAALQKKDIGKTISGPSIALDKQNKSGTVVTVNIADAKTKQPLGGAQVTLDGPDYLYDNTNGSGVASFVVPKAGTYEVRVSEENHRPFKSQVQVRTNEQDKPPVICEMEPKLTKDEGKDVIDVTVLWKDTTDEKSKPAPLKGASVRAGRITVGTDDGGKAKLTGAFEEKQEVVVDAAGYKSQRKIVNVAKILHYSAGQGAATFTLEPELSENSPIRIIVEVVDAASTKIDGADVEFVAANGTFLRALGTRNGEADFRSGDAPGVPTAELRKGISVSVKKKPEFKEVLNRSVPSNLLRPSLEAGTYRVELERDWTELEKALAALEARASALKNEAAAAATKAKTAETLIAKFPAAKGRVEEMLSELKKAEAEFKPAESKKRCEEADQLAKEIVDIQKQAAQKEDEIKKGLDEATGLAATCNSKAQADVIKTRYRDAIKAAGEISKTTKKAAEPHQKLARMAEAMKEGGPLKKQVEQALKKIEGEVEATKKESATANAAFNDAVAGALGIPGKRAALVSELGKIKTQFDLAKNDKLLPPELKTRVTNLEQLINSITAPKAPGVERLDEVMKPILAELDRSLIQARGTANAFDKALCVIALMDKEVEEINSHVSGATIELSAVADLPARADECIAKASQAPTPTPPGARPSPTPSPASPSPSPAVDEVTVPDISRANGSDLKAMKAAAGPDMVGAIVATKASPSPGSTRLFAGQDPLAGAKAKRGSTLKIFVYQSLAQASATPSASPSPSAAVAAGTMPNLTGLTLEQAVARLPAGMRVSSYEGGDKPPKPELAYTVFSQTPPVGTKLDLKKPPLVTVKVYGAKDSTVGSGPERFDGSYTGSYTGDDKGAVRFTVSNGVIAITNPGRGTGHISQSGSASISGSGVDGKSSYSFSGTFAIGPGGKATAGGTWTGQQSGFTGHGSWSASRR